VNLVQAWQRRYVLHCVVVALYARSRLGRGCESLDHLSDLLLELLHLLHILVIKGGDENQSYIRVSENGSSGGLAVYSPSKRTIWVVYIIFAIQMG
jgi:hypothetical protein